MSESTRILILFILILIFLVVVALYGQALMTKRAFRAIIKSMRDKQAISPQTAKLPIELGIRGKSIFQMRGFRDYKPDALQFLHRQDIVQSTEDGKIYLSEEKLLESGLESRINRKK